MKKFFALMLAMMLLLCTCAFAEEAAEETATVTTDPQVVAEAVANQDVLDYSIVMDKLPDGVTMTTDNVGGILYAVFTSEAEDSTKYIVSVGYSEQFGDYTMTEDLTDEEMAQAVEALTSEGYANPTVGLLETAYGTKVLYIDENGADSDYAEMVSIWKGYVINMFYSNESRELTEEDRDTGLTILSDMWVVEQ